MEMRHNFDYDTYTVHIQVNYWLIRITTWMMTIYFKKY